MKRFWHHARHALCPGPLTGRRRIGVDFLFAGFLWFLVSWSQVIADPWSKAQIPEELAYRAIQIDAEHFSSWTVPGMRYLPIRRDDFSRLFEGALAAGREIPVPVRSMQFNLHIEENGLLVGTADIEVDEPLIRESPSNTGDASRKGQVAADPMDVSANPRSTPRAARFLELDSEGLSVTDARWIIEEGETIPARWGTSGWSAQDGKGLQGVLLDRSGTLRLKFLAKGYRDGPGISCYRIHFPTAPLQQMVLDYPQELTPEIDGAHILAIDQIDLNRRRIEYRLAPQRPIQITIRNPALRRIQFRKASIQHHTQYIVGKRGLDILSDFWIASAEDLPTSFEIAAEQEVVIKTIEIDGQSVEWSYEETSTNEQTRIRFQLRDHTDQHRIHVVVQCMARVQLNTSWRLPKLRLEDLFWSQGSVTLSVREPLLVDSLQIVDCLQISATPDTEDSLDPDPADIYRFEEYTSAATIDLQLVRQQAIPSSCPLLVAVVGSQGIFAKAIIELSLPFTSQQDPFQDIESYPAEENVSLHDGPPAQSSTDPSDGLKSEIDKVPIVHTFNIPVGTNWAIESVEGVAGVSVRDWYIRAMGNRNNLIIAISTFLSAESREHHSRLVIHGNKYTPLEQTEWRMNDFNMVQLQPDSEKTTRIFLQPAPKYGLYRSDGKSIEAKTFPTGDPELLLALGSVNNPLFYPMPDQGMDVALRLERRGPEFEATLKNHVELTGSLLSQTLEIQILPREGILDTVDVDVIGGMADQIAWEFAGDQKPIAARCILHHLDDTTGHRYARWRLSLTSQGERPIRLQGIVHSPINEAGSLLMASVNRANQQEGHVDVLCIPTNSVRIDCIGLVREAILPTSSNAIPESCGLYRYNPNQDVGLYAGPSIVLRFHAGPTADPWGWIPSAELLTVPSPDGQIRYTAIMNVETTGLNHFTCRLPIGAKIMDLTVAGRSIPWTAGNPMNRDSETRPNLSEIVVELPAKDRYPVVRICYIVPEESFGRMHRIRPFIVAPSLSVGAWRGSMMIPTGYKIVDPFEFENSIGQSIVNRFLGPLAILNHTIPNSPLLQNSIGWHQYSIAPDRPVYLVHARTAWLLFFLLFCIFVTLIIGPLAHYGWCQAGLLAFFCAATLILPLTWVPMVSGAFLGCASAIMARWIRVHWSIRSSSWNGKQERSFAATMLPAKCLGLMVPLLAASAMRAGEALPKPAMPKDHLADSSTQSRFHQVLIPIDKDRQPTGDSIFLSDQFYRLLLVRNHQNLYPAGDWLITKADYAGRLKIGENLPSSGSWSATYQVYSLIRDAWLHLPLIANEAEWNQHAIVDGIEVPITWITEDTTMGDIVSEPGAAGPIRVPSGIRRTALSEEGAGLDHCAIPLSEPGPHQIQIRFVPRTRSNGSTEEWSIRIPRVTNSELVLTAPGMDVVPDSIHVDEAIAVTNQSGKHHYQLKDTDRLTVRHQNRHTAFNASHQLLRPRIWIHNNPDYIRMSLSLHVPRQGKGTNSIGMRLDPRLEFLGFDNSFLSTGDLEKEIAIEYPEGTNGERTVHDGVQSDASVQPSERMDADAGNVEMQMDDVASGDKKAMRLYWDASEEKPLDIRLLFELSGSSGIGKFQLPQIEYFGIRTLKAEIGLTVAEPLELEIDPSPSALELDPGKFAAAWGEELTPPQRAFEISYLSASDSRDPNRGTTEFLWSVRYRKSAIPAGDALDGDRQMEPPEDTKGHAEPTQSPEKPGGPEATLDRNGAPTTNTLSVEKSDPPDTPRIKSARIRLLQDSTKNKEMAACLSLLSGGATECDIVLPANCRLLHVTLSGVPMAPVKNGNHAKSAHWRLDLNASFESQIICIHYEIGPFAFTDPHHASLPAPQLKIQGKWVPTERAYWHVPPYGTWFPQIWDRTSSQAGKQFQEGPFLTHSLSPLTVVWKQRLPATSVRRTAVAALMLIIVGGLSLFARVRSKST